MKETNFLPKIFEGLFSYDLLCVSSRFDSKLCLNWGPYSYLSAGKVKFVYFQYNLAFIVKKCWFSDSKIVLTIFNFFLKNNKKIQQIFEPPSFGFEITDPA
jgi:hypothetical protein